MKPGRVWSPSISQKKGGKEKKKEREKKKETRRHKGAGKTGVDRAGRKRTKMQRGQAKQSEVGTRVSYGLVF